MATYDAIVIGAGHNGLTAAAYLGRAGLKVLVLERRPVVGGAAVTEEFHPGYRNSIASYTLSLLRPEIIRDLELKRHGLETIPFRGSMDVFSDGRTLQFSGDEARDRAQVARFSNRDYEQMGKLRTQLQRVGDIVRAQLLREPPDLSGGIGSVLDMLRIGGGLRRLTPEDRHFLIQMFTLSANDLMERWFESEPIRQSYAVHCVSSNFASLDAPGSAIPFFINVLGEFEGKQGKWGLAKGGMGAVTRAMAKDAREHGVEIQTDAPVRRIIVENRGATGVELESGERIAAKSVLANTDPKRTFLRLVGREHLDADFADGIEHLRMGHASLRMNLALKGEPRFAALSGEEQHIALGSAITVLPSRAEAEENYRRASAGRMPVSPYIALMMPSALDDSLAPPGHHVMSLLCKYYPYHLAEGDWDSLRDPVADGIIAELSRHIPNLPELIVGRQVLTPVDLERIFGLTEGDIFHGRHDLDQIFSLRPHPKAARYGTPIDRLYLCGSGSHPGGGVSGAPGHNAAKRVIRDRKRF